MFDSGDRRHEGEHRPPTALKCSAGVVHELAVDLAAWDLGSLEGRSLMDTVLALEGLQRSLDAVKARAISKLDASDITCSETGLATKTWKSNRTHVAPGVVARELRIAKVLRLFEAFGRALAAGRISVEHVVALDNASNPRVLDALVQLQESLVDFAARNRFVHYVAHLRSLVSFLDEDGPEPNHGDQNSARIAADGAGNLHLVMDLAGVDAITAQRIITDETDRAYRAAVREQEASGTDIPPAPVLRARAIIELLSRGAKADPASPKPAVEAIISITADRDGHPTHITTIDGEAVDPISAAVLLCDAHLQPVVVDPTGRPLALGRTTRLFNAGQRRALIARDGGCAFPGCDQPPARCAAHHVVEWSHGGPTDLTNGLLLCPRHHGLVHGTNSWSVESVPIDRLEALDPDLFDQHVRRAEMVGLVPDPLVRMWNGPNGQLLLAQCAADHRGPPPERQDRSSPLKGP